MNTSYNVQTIASGLDFPGGIALGPDGAIYVVETGSGGPGPVIPGPPLAQTNQTYGPTGAVTRIHNGVQERIITGLPSFQEIEIETGEFRPTALGPHDIKFDESGDLIVLMGYGTDTDYLSTLEDIGVTELGHLLKYDLDKGGPPQLLADLSGYEAANDTDGTGETLTNPYKMVIHNDTIAVVDPGANVLLQVEDGGTEIGAYTLFPERETEFNGAPFAMQSVPTGVTIGPDGAYYVAELTGVPFPANESRIYRVEEIGDEPTVYADGFTHIMDLEFDEKGNLFVLQYTTESFFERDPLGALIKVTPDGTRTTISGEELYYPTHLALGSNGEIYVSNGNPTFGEGELLVYNPAVSVGEPWTGHSCNSQSWV
jgi:hypothetical protein